MITSNEMLLVKSGTIDGYDLYRKHYEEFTFKELQEINNAWDKIYPTRKFFHPDIALKCLKLIISETDESDINVVELGCNQGQLAKILLSFIEIKRYDGYDICESALKRSVVYDNRYKTILLKNHFVHYDNLAGINLFISTHTLEHLSEKEVTDLLFKIKDIEYFLFEVPLIASGESWEKDLSSHVLKSGRDWLHNEIKKVGHELIYQEHHTTLWKKISDV